MRQLPWTGHFDRVVDWSTAFGYFDNTTNHAVLIESLVPPVGWPAWPWTWTAWRPDLLLPSRVVARAANVGDVLVDHYHLDTLTGGFRGGADIIAAVPAGCGS